jgi:hypothetical protein
VQRTTGTTAVPKTPKPKDPNDWRQANLDPAATNPIPDWIPAAVDPAATPLTVHPKTGITYDEATLRVIAVPPPTAAPITNYLAIYLVFEFSLIMYLLILSLVHPKAGVI